MCPSLSINNTILAFSKVTLGVRLHILLYICIHVLHTWLIALYTETRLRLITMCSLPVCSFPVHAIHVYSTPIYPEVYTYQIPYCAGSWWNASLISMYMYWHRYFHQGCLWEEVCCGCVTPCDWLCILHNGLNYIHVYSCDRAKNVHRCRCCALLIKCVCVVMGHCVCIPM